jgi:hypothetical protein
MDSGFRRKPESQSSGASPLYESFAKKSNSAAAEGRKPDWQGGQDRERPEPTKPGDSITNYEGNRKSKWIPARLQADPPETWKDRTSMSKQHDSYAVAS